MFTQVKKTGEKKGKTMVPAVIQKMNNVKQSNHFIDNRPEMVKQKKQCKLMQSSQLRKLRQNIPTQLKRVVPVAAGAIVTANGTYNPHRAEAPDALDVYNVNIPQNGIANPENTARTAYRQIGAYMKNQAAAGYLNSTIMKNRVKNGATRNAYLGYMGLGVLADENDATARPYLMALHSRDAKPNPAELTRSKNKPGIADLADPIKTDIKINDSNGPRDLLKISVEYAEDWKGYITNVTHYNAGAQDWSSDMENRQQLDPGVAVTPGFATYSNRHHRNQPDTITTELGRASNIRTEAQNEKSVDAYTKHIAEGGRFLSVAALGANLKDTSKFYTIDQAGTEARHVEFQTLWNHWDRFNTKFGVTDDEVKDKLWSNQNALPPQTNIPDKTTFHPDVTHDYNLGDR